MYKLRSVAYLFKNGAIDKNKMFSYIRQNRQIGKQPYVPITFSIPEYLHNKVYSHMSDDLKEKLTLFTEDKIWEMVDEVLRPDKTYVFGIKDEKFKKLIDTQNSKDQDKYNVIWRSRKSTLDPREFAFDWFEDKEQTIHMSDWLMFNRYPIDEELVERYLRRIRFKCRKDVPLDEFYIDCWKVTISVNDYDWSNVEYDSTKFDELDFPTSDEDIKDTALILLRIMGKLPESHINMHNYHAIARWYFRNYDDIQSSFNFELQKSSVFSLLNKAPRI